MNSLNVCVIRRLTGCGGVGPGWGDLALPGSCQRVPLSAPAAEAGGPDPCHAGGDEVTRGEAPGPGQRAAGKDAAQEPASGISRSALHLQMTGTVALACCDLREDC